MTAARVLYLYVARWLPASTTPGGRMWRCIRRVVARPLLAHAGADINVERGASFWPGQVSLGDRSGIGIDCALHGPVTIGSDVMMGPEVVIFTANHAFENIELPMIDQGHEEPRLVTIEDDVWIGQRAMILPGVTVGRGAIIAAGAIVTHDVPAFAIVGGNPARVIRSRRQEGLRRQT